MSIETPAGHARNAALAMVTALLDGDDEAAWAIARSNGHDPATLAVLLARVVAKSTTPEAWRQSALDIAAERGVAVGDPPNRIPLPGIPECGTSCFCRRNDGEADRG